MLIRIAGRHILLTAAHVIDLRHEGKLCIPGPKGATEFAGSLGANLLTAGVKRHQDPVDIGYLVPSSDPYSEIPAEYTPIDLEEIDLAEMEDEKSFHLVAGFPLSRKWAKHSNSVLTMSRLNFVGIGLTNTECESAGYDPKINLLLEYHLDKAVYPEGDRASAPSPRGMSGGGVFRIGRNTTFQPDSSQAKFVGIMHTFNERKHLFVTTRVRTILDILSESLPRTLRSSVGQ